MRIQYKYLILIIILIPTIYLCLLWTYELNHSNDSEQTYLTWEVPSFAYVNNQLILHIVSSIYNPTSRTLIHPKLWFPPISNTQSRYVDISSLYEIENVKYDGQYKDLDEIKDASASTAKYVRINNDKESYWAYMYPRFIVYTFVIGGHWRQKAHLSMNKFQFRKDGVINKCLKKAKELYPVEKSIGVHLRTWAKDVSLADSHECERIYKNNPLKLLWSCRMKEDNLSKTIDWISKDAPILIATDDVHAPIISNLKAKYDKLYLIDYDKLLEQCFVETAEFNKEWMKVHGLAMLDSELLANTKYFIGNVFSTFSDIVAIKRKDNSYFVQTSGQYIIEHFMYFWVMVIIFIVLSPFIALFITYKKRTTSASKV